MKRIIIIASLIISFNVYAAGDPVPNIFTAGESIVASEFNANFQELANRIDNLQTNNSSLLQFVGNSSGTIDGISGVRAMTELCQVTHPISRICTTEEYTKTINFPAAISSSTSAWISPSLVVGGGNGINNHVVPAADVYSGKQYSLTSSGVRDFNCSGWSSSGASFGLSVNGVGGFAESSCQNAIAVSCCK